MKSNKISMHRNASKAKRPRPFIPVTGEPEIKLSPSEEATTKKIKVTKGLGIGITTMKQAKSIKRKKKK